MWSKKLELISEKKITIFKGLYISHQKKMKEIILNNYMQNIYFGFDEIYFEEKGLMDNNYNCN